MFRVLGMFQNAKSFNQNLDDWQPAEPMVYETIFANSGMKNIPKWAHKNNGKEPIHIVGEGIVFSPRIVTTSDHGSNDNHYFDVIGYVTDVTSIDTYYAYTINNINFKSYKGVENWDVSNVTEYYSTFSYTDFNEDISNWNVSKAESMVSMFSGAKKFNQDISKWDVSNVEDMSSMFQEAKSFNQDISRWNVSKVKDMTAMFSGAENFNQDISKWNISSVTKMEDFLFDAVNFKYSIDKWKNFILKNKFKNIFNADTQTVPEWYKYTYTSKKINLEVYKELMGDCDCGEAYP